MRNAISAAYREETVTLRRHFHHTRDGVLRKTVHQNPQHKKSNRETKIFLTFMSISPPRYLQMKISQILAVMELFCLAFSETRTCINSPYGKVFKNKSKKKKSSKSFFHSSSVRTTTL